MKQIEYTEKQKIVLEVLEQVEKEFKPNKYASTFQKQEYFDKIIRIKSSFDIKEKFLTLREYLEEISCGAYHNFKFKIDNINIEIIGVSEFERYYNPNLLDKYYVIGDIEGEVMGDIHIHDLELAEKE